MRSLVLHIFICSLLLTGCYVQKRKYQKGFYFSSSHSATQRSKSQTGLKELYMIPTDENMRGPIVSGFASSRARLLKADSCDVIVFNDGTEIKARVIELDDRILRYRFCDDDPKIRTANRMQLVRIKYANGSTVEMKTTSAVQSPSIVPEEFPKSQTLATSPAPSTSVQPTTAPAPVKKSDTTVISKKPCDRILFRDGSEESAKIIEIGLTDIRYKSCAMPNGPDYVKLKSSIFFVEYANGQKEVFRQEPAYEEPVYRKRVVKRNGQAISAFIFSLLSIYPMWIVGSIIALSMAIPYLNKHKKDPETYDQPKLARTAIIIACISLGLIAFFILMGAFI